MYFYWQTELTSFQTTSHNKVRRVSSELEWFSFDLDLSFFPTDLGPYCLPYGLPKNISRLESRCRKSWLAEMISEWEFFWALKHRYFMAKMCCFSLNEWRKSSFDDWCKRYLTWMHQNLSFIIDNNITTRVVKLQEEGIMTSCKYYLFQFVIEI